MPIIRCLDCGFAYPKKEILFLCPNCGGIFDFEGPFLMKDGHDSNLLGIWRWGVAQNFECELPIVSLGEGNTPLVWDTYQGKQIGMKCEYLNPTGSYKDRGTSVLVSHLLARKVKNAAEDSSGNAGASFAAYAARAGIHASVFVPDSASGPKKSQIRNYGAEIIEVPGSRENAAKAVREKAKNGIVYASHAYLPFGLNGIATIAYEIVDQMGKIPGTIISPIGHGGALLGISRGFYSLSQKEPGLKIPYYVGVQAVACSPVVNAFSKGEKEIDETCCESATVGEGIKVKRPVRGNTLLKELSNGKGSFISIREDEIIPDTLELSRRGFYVEPTSALVWSACKKMIRELPEPIILVLTGSGLKYRDTSN